MIDKEFRVYINNELVSICCNQYVLMRDLVYLEKKFKIKNIEIKEKYSNEDLEEKEHFLNKLKSEGLKYGE